MDQRETGDFPPKKQQPSQSEASPSTTNVVRKLDYTLFSSKPASSRAGRPPLPHLRRPPLPQLRRPPAEQPQLEKTSMSQQSTWQSAQHSIRFPFSRVLQESEYCSSQPAPILPRSNIRKPEFTRSWPGQSVTEVIDGTPKKLKQCRCTFSRCLLLYCECFGSGVYCDGCDCKNCHNNVENEAARREAVQAALKRNPNAFKPKIAASSLRADVIREGCNCKRSECLRIFCRCFGAHSLCSENCRCVDCQNYEGSEERKRAFHGEHANIFDKHLESSAAIAKPLGSPLLNLAGKGHDLLYSSTLKDLTHRLEKLKSEGCKCKRSECLRMNCRCFGAHILCSGNCKCLDCKNYEGSEERAKILYNKGKGHDLLYSSTMKDPPAHSLEWLKSVASVPLPTFSSIPGAVPSNNTSLLAGIIQPSDVKELCSVLVANSVEAARRLAEKQAGDSRESSLVSSRQDGADVSKERPMSRSTIALASSSGSVECNEPSRLTIDQGLTECYPEQERIVLTQLRDCLNKLIILGEARAGIQSGEEKDVMGSSRSIPNVRVQRVRPPINSVFDIPGAPVDDIGHQKKEHAKDGNAKTKPE